MCGLCGVYSTNFGQWEYDTFQKLLVMNVWRGDHSTGIIRGQVDGRILSRKSLLASPQFVYSDVSDIIEDEKNFKKPYFLMGHTRHATKGSITLKNAHPFQFANVIGMHNGTIQTPFKHRDEFETDSEAFYKNLNDYGLLEALNEIQAYDTAYAFTFVDKKAKTLNFVKNSRRPLYFTYAFLGSTLIWSSEKQDIEYVLRRKNYINNEGWKGSKEDRYFTLYEDHLFSIPIGRDPRDHCSMTKLDVEKKSYSVTARGSTGTTSVSTRRTSDNPNLGAYGEWIETEAGWRFVHKEGTLPGLPEGKTKSDSLNQPTKSSCESRTNTSMTTGGTSGQTGDSQSTSTPSSSIDPKEDITPRDHSFRRNQNCRDRFGPDRLKTLDWLEGEGSSPLDGLFDTNFDAANSSASEERGNVIPFVEAKSRKGGIKGFRGELVNESEFRFRLSQGCFCCGEIFNLDNPHDFAQINNIHWWDRERWACDYCYHNSANDWVKKTIEDEWEADHPGKSYIEG